MKDTKAIIATAILAALSHDEAEDGLYFSNLFHLHEEDERDAVPGTPDEIATVLDDLIRRGQVISEGEGDQAVYRLAV